MVRQLAQIARQRSSDRAFRGGLIGLLIWLLTTPAWGQAADEQVVLIMVEFRDAAAESRDTEAAVRAGLSTVDAALKVEWRAPPRNEADALAMARSVLRTQGGRVVFWCRDQQLVFFIPELDEGRLLQRSIDSSVTESFSDTAALIVRRVIDSLLSRTDTPAEADTAIAFSALPRSDAGGLGVPAAGTGAVLPDAAAAPNDDGKARVQSTAEPTRFGTMPTIRNETATEPVDTMAEAAPAETIGDKAPKASQNTETVVAGPEEAAPKREAKHETPTRMVHAHPLAPPPRLELDMLYGLDGIATGYAACHGARFGLGVRLVKRLYLLADYTLSTPIEKPIGSVSGSLRLERHPVGIGVKWLFFVTARWRLGAGLLVELDPIHHRTTTSDDSVDTISEGTDVQIGIVPVALAAIRLVGPLFASIGLGMRMVVDKTRYFANMDPETSRIVAFSPWRIQPRLSLGLSGRFF